MLLRAPPTKPVGVWRLTWYVPGKTWAKEKDPLASVVVVTLIARPEVDVPVRSTVTPGREKVKLLLPRKIWPLKNPEALIEAVGVKRFSKISSFGRALKE
jgi:hypothetical protein